MPSIRLPSDGGTA